MTEDSFEQVKRLMKIVGGKAIIVEDGKPTFVIASVDEYSYPDIKGAAKSETELIEKINKDIAIWKSRQKEKELKQMEKELFRKDREIEIVPDSGKFDI